MSKKQNNGARFAPAILREVINLGYIALGVFLVMALFIPSSGGVAGSFLSAALRSFFGVGAYIFPFGLIAFSVYSILIRDKLKISDIIMICLVFMLIITLSHVFFGNSPSIREILVSNATNHFVVNGGGLGAIFGIILLTIFGSIGSAIIIISSIIVLSVVLTKKSFVNVVSKSYKVSKTGVSKVAESLRYDNQEGDLYYDDDDDDNHYVGTSKKSSFEEIIISPQPQSEARPQRSEARPQKFTFYDEKEPKPQKIALYDELKEEVGITIKGMEEARPSTESYDTSKSRGDFYEFPSEELLGVAPPNNDNIDKGQILANSKKLEKALKSFGVEAKVMEVSKGPTVTRYELAPGVGVKVSKISGLADDLALSLAARGIRIEAPIPGKSAVGIEVPNEKASAVYFRELIESDAFKTFPSNLAFALGKDIAGSVVVTDIAKMPHLLIAGATGSGKSVCINTLIVSLIYKSSPDDVKLILIDPKVVELSVYNGIPHLLIPVVTDPNKAAGALNWAVREMLQRYENFASSNVRDLAGYNKTLQAKGEETLPQIVIIVDELSDLMMAASKEVEDSICRLAQMARAAGLHLIIATQRPSVDVITGIIKANVPSRLAFSVSSSTDSRTILDGGGAEKLLGRGDMLFRPIGMNKPLRIQGAFITDKEVESIVTHLKSLTKEEPDEALIEEITSSTKTISLSDDIDELFDEAAEFVIQKEKASTSLLQRQFRIGYQRASRIIEALEDSGIIGAEDGSKPRKVLLTLNQWERLKKGD